MLSKSKRYVGRKMCRSLTEQLLKSHTEIIRHALHALKQQLLVSLIEASFLVDHLDNANDLPTTSLGAKRVRNDIFRLESSFQIKIPV